MNYYFLFAFVAFLVSAFVWIYVFAQEKRDSLHVAFLLFAADNLGWVGTDLLLYLDFVRGHETTILKLSSLFWVPCGFWFLFFAYALVGKKRDAILRISAVASVFGVAVVLFTDAVVIGVKPSPWGVVPFFHPIYQPLVSMITAFPSAVAVWLMTQKRRESTDPKDRRALSLLIWGAMLVMGSIAVTNVLLPGAFDVHDSPMVGSSAFVIFVVLVFLAVTRYRFLSVSLEEVAERLFEDIDEGVFLVDPSGRILRSNAAARAIFGDKIDGDNEHDLFKGRDLSQDFADMAVSYGAVDAEKKHYAVSTSSVRRGGETLGKIYIAREVTDQKRAETVLQNRNAELEKEVEDRTRLLKHAQRMEAVGILAGGIAHDFNNVLAVILGFANAAKQDASKSSQIYRDLDEIILAGNHGRDIVRQILTVSRKKDIADYTVSDLCSIVRETLEMLQVSLPLHISIDLKLPKEPVGVLCDNTQIAQVLMNLCNNAVHAMKGRRFGVLSVEVERRSVDAHVSTPGCVLHPGRYAALVVKDNGTGIEESLLPQIFTPFFTTKPQGEGTGLGLATTVIILENHNGGVTVKSKVGKGTEFCIYLPAPKQTAAEVDAMVARDSDPPEPYESHLELILLVDDEPQVRRMGKRVLEQLGYDVVAVNDAEEALGEVDTDFTKYDLIITDYNMPKMTGVELASALKSRGSRIPVLLMSGYGDKVTREEMDAAGIAVFIQKPAPKKQLGAAIRRILDDRGSYIGGQRQNFSSKRG